MRSGWKISYVLFLLILFYAGFGWIMDTRLGQISERNENLFTGSIPVMRSTLAATKDSMAISRNIKDMLLVDNFDHRKTRLSEIEIYERSIERNVNLLRESVVGDEGKQLVEKAAELFRDQRVLRKRITDEIFSGNIQSGRVLAEAQGVKLMRIIEDTMTKIISYADSQIMHSRVQGADHLRNSKVIIYSAGMIIALLSALFIILFARWLNQSLQIVRNSIKNSTYPSVNLTLRLPTPSIGHINEAVNELLAAMDGEINHFHQFASGLARELKSTNAFEGKLPQAISDISAELTPVTEKLRDIAHSEINHEQSERILHNLLNQIVADLTILIKISSRQSLKLEEIKTTQTSAESQALIESLEEDGKMLRTHVRENIESINRIFAVISTLRDHLDDIIATASKHRTIASRIHDLTKRAKQHEAHLIQLRVLLEKLNATLEGLKIS